jgi:hypothetical protein
MSQLSRHIRFLVRIGSRLQKLKGKKYNQLIFSSSGIETFQNGLLNRPHPHPIFGWYQSIDWYQSTGLEDSRRSTLRVCKEKTWIMINGAERSFEGVFVIGKG